MTTTPLPEPAFRGPLSGEPFWNLIDMREHEAAGFRRGIEAAANLCHCMNMITLTTGMECEAAIRKLGETR